MVESSWNSNTGRVSGKTWHFSTRKLSGQNLQITSFWSFKEEFHLHSQVSHVTVIWLSRPHDPGVIQTVNSSKTRLSLRSNSVCLMCLLFPAFYKEKKKADLIHTCQSKCLNQAKVRTYKFSCYCQTDLGLNLSSNNYYKSLNFSSLSLPFCSKGSMTLMRLESRKKGWVQEESLFRIRGLVPPLPPAQKKLWR